MTTSQYVSCSRMLQRSSSCCSRQFPNRVFTELHLDTVPTGVVIRDTSSIRPTYLPSPRQLNQERARNKSAMLTHNGRLYLILSASDSLIASVSSSKTLEPKTHTSSPHRILPPHCHSQLATRLHLALFLSTQLTNLDAPSNQWACRSYPTSVLSELIR